MVYIHTCAYLPHASVLFLDRCGPCEVDVTVAKHIIIQHQYRVITGENEEDRQRLHVRRSNLVIDTLNAFSRRSFDVSKMLKVVFISEGSVDEGGPRREFFQLAVKEVLKCGSYFTG